MVTDQIDRDILQALARNARISFTDLAAQVQLSANAVADRVRRLERSKVIRAYRLEVDRRALGHTLKAYVDVKLQPETAAADFEKAVQRIRGVTRLALTTGAFDFSLVVECADEADFVRLIEELRAAVQVAETYSRLILREQRLTIL